MSASRLNEPSAIRVRLDAARLPTSVWSARSGRWVDVEHVLDVWQIDDRWWTDDPVRRCYFSCQTRQGSCITIFYDVDADGWYAHPY